MDIAAYGAYHGKAIIFVPVLGKIGIGCPLRNDREGQQEQEKIRYPEG